MSEQYLLLACSPHRGKLNQTVIWKLTWLKVSDNSVWTLTADPAYDNFSMKKWDRFVTDPVYGLYTNMKETNRTSKEGFGVLSADKRPTLVEPLTQNQAIEVAEVLMAEPA